MFYLRESRLVAALVAGRAMTAQDELWDLLRARAVVRDRAALERVDRPVCTAFASRPRETPVAGGAAV